MESKVAIRIPYEQMTDEQRDVYWTHEGLGGYMRSTLRWSRGLLAAGLVVCMLVPASLMVGWVSVEDVRVVIALCTAAIIAMVAISARLILDCLRAMDLRAYFAAVNGPTLREVGITQ